MNILVLNCGSSSVKFQLIATDLERIAQNQDERLARGVIERIGGEAIVTLRAEGRSTQRSTAPLRDTRAAIEFVLRWACSEGRAETLLAGGINGQGNRAYAR